MLFWHWGAVAQLSNLDPSPSPSPFPERRAFSLLTLKDLRCGKCWLSTAPFVGSGEEISAHVLSPGPQNNNCAHLPGRTELQQAGWIGLCLDSQSLRQVTLFAVCFTELAARVTPDASLERVSSWSQVPPPPKLCWPRPVISPTYLRHLQVLFLSAGSHSALYSHQVHQHTQARE